MNPSSPLALDELLSPPPEFSPAYFWSLNDKLEKTKLLEQLQDMVDCGVRSVCIHPLPKEFRPQKFACNLEPEYLSDEYFLIISDLLNELNDKGLNAYMYDEGGWPSGGAAGRVMATDPESFSRQTLKNKDNGEVFVEKEKTDIESWPPYPDLLNPGATETFIRLTHERHKAFMGKFFGGTIKYTFTDEPAFPHARFEGDKKQLPWTNNMEETFKKIKGYGIKPYLTAFFKEKKNFETRKVLVDYYDVLSQIFTQNFLRPIKEWCRKNNLKSGGHFGGEDIPDNNAKAGFGHILRALRELDLPGIDAIWRQIHPKNGQCFFPKYAQSVARQSEENNLVLSESFMIYGNGLTPAEMKWIIDQQLAQGVTNFIFGHYSYSTRDHFMAFARPIFGRKNPFWKKMKTLHKYTERMSFLLSRGKSDCSLAVYFPIRDIWAGGNFQKKAVASHNKTALKLLKSQIDFDFIDDDVLCIENINGKFLNIGPASYNVILMPETKWITEASMNALSLFKKNGGKVLTIKDFPKIKEHIEPLFKTEYPRPNIIATKRKCSNCNIYFIFNTGNEKISANIFFKEKGEALLYDFQNNTLYKLKRLKNKIKLILNKWESKTIIFTGKNSALFKSSEESQPQEFETVQTLPGAWKLRVICQHIAGKNDFEIKDFSDSPHFYGSLCDWKELPETGKDFSGELEYMKEFYFAATSEENRFFLDLGKVKYTAEIEINGKKLPPLLWAPFRREISGLIRKGKNSLKIRVANSLANAILKGGIAREWENNYGIRWPSIKGSFYNERQMEFEKDSLCGGLYGPVRIMKNVNPSEKHYFREIAQDQVESEIP